MDSAQVALRKWAVDQFYTGRTEVDTAGNPLPDVPWHELDVEFELEEGYSYSTYTYESGSFNVKTRPKGNKQWRHHNLTYTMPKFLEALFKYTVTDEDRARD